MPAKLILLLVCGLASSSLAFPDLSGILGKRYLPWKIGTCKFNIYQENFEPEQFFNGTWYVERSYGNYIYQADATCPTMAGSVKGDKAQLLHYEYEPLMNKYIYMRGTVNIKDIKKSTFNEKYDFFAGLTNVQIPYTVLGTDYNNYAVVYSCQQSFGVIAEMSWVMTRTRGDNANEEEVKKIIEEDGLNYADFIVEEEKHCPPNEPQM